MQCPSVHAMSEGYHSDLLYTLNWNCPSRREEAGGRPQVRVVPSKSSKNSGNIRRVRNVARTPLLGSPSNIVSSRAMRIDCAPGLPLKFSIFH